MALTAKTYVGAQTLDDMFIEETFIDQVSPCGVMFEVQGYTTDQYLSAGFVWFFDDGGDYDLLATGHPFKTGGKSFAIGPKAARVFETAGTHNYSCHIIHKGEYRVIRGVVIVVASGDIYDDTNTFYYDPSGTFSGEATGASNQYTSASTLKTAVAAYGGDAMIKLARGQTFTDMGGQYSWRFDTTFSGQQLTFSAYGAGAKPVLNGPDMQFLEPGRAKFENISFEGYWDSTIENLTSGSDVYDGMYTYLTDNKQCRLLWHKCDFNGLGKSVYFNQTTALDGLSMFSECSATNWQDYGLFGQDEKYAVIGCSICQDPDALGGGDANKYQWSNNHSPGRSSGTDQVVWASEFFSNCGWFIASGTPSHGPAWRIWSTSGFEKTASIAGCTFEGGAYVMSLDNSAAASNPSRPKHLRVTSNMLMASNNTYYGMLLSYGGTGIDNNVITMPSRTLNENEPFNHWIALSSTTPDASNYTRPIYVMNNTFAALGSAGFSEALYNGMEATLDAAVSGSSPTYTGSIWENNHYYAPNHSWLAITDNVDTTPVLTPRYKGFRYGQRLYTGTLASNVVNGGTLTIAYDEGDNTWYDNDKTQIVLGVTHYDCTFTFNASDFTITNTSGVTWPSGSNYQFSLALNAANTPALNTTYATSATEWAYYSPTSGSSALGAATGNIAELDFFGNIRSASTAKGAFDGIVS